MSLCFNTCHCALILWWTLCSNGMDDTAVDPFVQSLSASPCHLSLNMNGVRDKDKCYLSLLLQSFQSDPINKRRATWSSLMSCQSVSKTRHNYSCKWNCHNIYSRKKLNILEHLSSEKPLPSSSYYHKTVLILGGNQGKEQLLSAAFAIDLTRPAVWLR